MEGQSHVRGELSRSEGTDELRERERKRGKEGMQERDGQKVKVRSEAGMKRGRKMEE